LIGYKLGNKNLSAKYEKGWIRKGIILVKFREIKVIKPERFLMIQYNNSACLMFPLFRLFVFSLRLIPPVCVFA